MMKTFHCLVLDDEPMAARELTELLRSSRGIGRVSMATGLRDGREVLLRETIDVLCIRIHFWDEYRKLMPLLKAEPSAIIFLSGRKDKCACYLQGTLDFHLQAPYEAGAWKEIYQVLQEPGYQGRKADFFFLRYKCRYELIPDESLTMIEWSAGTLLVHTKSYVYRVAGSLQHWQARLPDLLFRAEKGLLVVKGLENKYTVQRLGRRRRRAQGKMTAREGEEIRITATPSTIQ